MAEGSFERRCGFQGAWQFSGIDIATAATAQHSRVKVRRQAKHTVSWTRNRLAPLIIAMNVVLPLLSVLFLVITLSRMDRVALGREGRPAISK
jgi:hypothetical protein